jgi:electron transport complex protein RnfG
MGGVGLFCSLLIVFTYQTTLPIINQNKAEALEKAVFEVLPGTKTKVTFRITDNNEVEPFQGDPRGERLVYAGYDAQNSLVGIAIEASGKGFQDELKIIYGYAPENQAIIGMKVLESKETPGLGDKIEKDPAFVKNFEALDVSLNQSEDKIKNKIITVKSGEKEHPWEISGITGATISSKAVGQILAESTSNWIPVLYNDVDKIKGYR